MVPFFLFVLYFFVEEGGVVPFGFGIRNETGLHSTCLVYKIQHVSLSTTHLLSVLNHMSPPPPNTTANAAALQHHHRRMSQHRNTTTATAIASIFFFSSSFLCLCVGWGAYWVSREGDESSGRRMASVRVVGG